MNGLELLLLQHYTVRVEYNKKGIGSNTNNRFMAWAGYRKGINATDAANFTVSNFIKGDVWLLATGVPYSTGGLVL